MRHLSSVWIAALVLLTNRTGSAQEQFREVDGDRGPRFLLASASGHEHLPVDVARTPSLRRRISIAFDGVTLKKALTEIAQKGNLSLVYSRDIVSLDSPVHLAAENITVAGALSEVLLDAGVDVLMSMDGRAALVKRPAAVALQTGTIVGRVTDKKDGTALVGATLVVEGTSRSGSTDNDGHYRITELAPGTYTVRVRYIGYAPGTTSLTVTADQDATADFALEKSAQQLNEVVTTGTVVPTEVKAIPTPISVITAADIDLQRPHSVQELFRQAVPGAVSWDLPNFPQNTYFSVRGSSAFAGGGGQMKVFVDGVETASINFATVDPSSIERVEVIRGPQAAAIYGSDAIGGVIQVFTKRGDSSIPHPQVNAEAAVGATQTPYQGYGSVLRQEYKASVRGGGADATYDFGGSYSRTADYLPNGEQSAQSSPSAYAGFRFTGGIVTLDLSGRYYVHNAPNVFNPEAFATGYVPRSRPLFQPYQTQNQTLGARITVVPRSWWQNVVSAGFDRAVLDRAQSQPRLTTPADTLLQIFNQNFTKTSIGFNSSVQGSLGRNLSGSLTAGFDHYSLPMTLLSTTGALNTTGTIQTASGRTIGAGRTITNNTGYFAQAQVGLYDALFLTGGMRAEENTNFGDSLGTPVSPRVGVSYVQQVGFAALKFHGSYGRAIRPPSSGLKLASQGATAVVLANPALGPERQKGWDTGIDVVLGSQGSLSATYYNQIADDLIDQVLLQSSPVPTYQYQNIGRVKNTGVEVEARLTLGPVQVMGQYGYARSRIRQLAPNYQGDLRVGDLSLATPTHTAGASLTVAPYSGTTLSAGLTHVGSRNDYDFLAQYRCFGGTGPCDPGPGTRGYIVEYPSFTKLNATLSQRITRFLGGFVSVNNLTDTHAYEFLNLYPVIGRITTVGFRFQY